MEQFELHERFEMEVLSDLNSARLLNPLIFGGGTMLRLCHELNRYSLDLDFYLKDPVSVEDLESKIHTVLSRKYQITDQALKTNTLLFEIRTGQYPMRLKIEINRHRRITDFEQSIAWSRHDNRQVALNTIPLKDMLTMKIQAFLDRKEVRDAYDIEFMLRKGLPLTDDRSLLSGLKKTLSKLTKQDINVKLGSILEPEQRAYYRLHGFKFLNDRIRSAASSDR